MMASDPSPNEELLNLRDGIDDIDEQVLQLISRRARLAHRIGEIKQGNIYRPEREAQVLRRLEDSNPGPLPASAVKAVFREIMSHCLALEQPLKVAFLGPAGTFSESAARRHFGSAPTLLPLATIDDVFRAVEAGNASYGVVPVENSTEGAVGRTLDMLLSTTQMVCGEVMLRVEQNLMSRDTPLGEIRCVYSHAQSLAQCHEWLNRNLPGVPVIAVASNAEAARRASEEERAAAIAGEAAARVYDLNILSANIEDDPANTTRFLVMGEHDAGPSGRDKTSLIFTVQNRSGAVVRLLQPLADEGVSMTKLQSRPVRGFGNGGWQYVFYVDIEGHQSDPSVNKAIARIREEAGSLKVLGSYPVSVSAS
ncbi:MAG: prephenate dehydratase [Methyloversatilis sp.]|jgi:chorismate mutase/prephenate dehydratase|nr:prephenate dehydratase [Methyloversatilis sp.]MBP6194781.1 prephenate dehydratase [Methyloversatilis sp.]MBP9118187.1 prephenate dehydratase [Methyloversatilis sp.]